jgi:predicted molibdopterin-dependent oxidoreductase YjgC
LSKKATAGRLSAYSRAPVKQPKPRLTQPLVREDGVLRPATWEHALGRAAELFQGSTARHGAGSFGMFSCSKATNEVNYMAQKFVRAVMGSNHIDSCNRT